MMIKRNQSNKQNQKCRLPQTFVLKIRFIGDLSRSFIEIEPSTKYFSIELVECVGVYPACEVK
jgi:hypothetical protein